MYNGAFGFPRRVFYAIIDRAPAQYAYNRRRAIGASGFERGGGVVNLQPLLVIVVGLIILGLVWKVVKGVVRLVLIIALLLLVGYMVLNIVR